METVNMNFVEHEDWDFKGEDTRYLTHGLHPYPARMIPQIAGRLMERYARKRSFILDPFCGSGTVLVEARLHGMHSVGIDINPLACLIAEVKSTPLNTNELISWWKKLKERIGKDIWSFKFRLSDVEVPDFSKTNMEYWFKPTTMKELSIIRNHLKDIEEEKVRKFFEVPFSRTVREVSGVRKSEFKLLRMPENEWKKHLPDVFGIFVKHVEDAINRMAEFYKKCDKTVLSRVFMADTREMLSKSFPKEAQELIFENPPEAVITSPPYGDSKTTVAYGQFSRLSALWLDFEKGFSRKAIMSVDKVSLGGRSNKIKFKSPTLDETLEMIKERDTPPKTRFEEVASFFYDLYECLKNIYTILYEGGYCCIVIANRTVRRVQIPTHIIISEMGVEIGFENNITIIPRNIPTKRLPWENAPENIPGLKGKTMSKENIIIMRKPT